MQDVVLAGRDAESSPWSILESTCKITTTAYNPDYIVSIIRQQTERSERRDAGARLFTFRDFASRAPSTTTKRSNTIYRTYARSRRRYTRYYRLLERATAHTPSSQFSPPNIPLSSAVVNTVPLRDELIWTEYRVNLAARLFSFSFLFPFFSFP